MKNIFSKRTAGNSAVGMIIFLVVIIVLAIAIIMLVNKNRDLKNANQGQENLPTISQDSSTTTLEAELSSTDTSSLDSDYNAL